MNKIMDMIMHCSTPTQKKIFTLTFPRAVLKNKQTKEEPH